MAKYRKLPVVIEAMQVPSPMTGKNAILHGTFFAWLHMQAADRRWCVANGQGEIDIETLEGTMRARNGDWVIVGVQGEIYPCKDEIFHATHEPVGE